MRSNELLVLEEQLAVLRGLLPIFDHAANVAFQMRKLGFRKFQPISLAAHAAEFSQEDIELSALVALERAKESFAWPSMGWLNGNVKRKIGNLVYRSPVIQTLKTERAAYVREWFRTLSHDEIP